MIFSQIGLVNGGFPYKKDLVAETGYVSWVDKYDYGIRFGFFGNDLNFDYPSKADGQRIVHDSLLNSEGKLVSVLYEFEDPTSPIYSEDKFYSVFEVAVDGQNVRTYEESEEAWKSDNKLFPLIIALFLGGGAYIAVKTLKERKYA